MASGGGGGGIGYRGSMGKFGIWLLKRKYTLFAIHKLGCFFLPVITTGFDRKKYSWKNFSLEGRGILSHVAPMLTGPE